MSEPPRWIESERVWAITRYQDAVTLLKSDDVVIVEAASNLKMLSDRMGKNAFPNLIRLLGTSHPFQNGAAHRDAHLAIRSLIGTVQRRWPPDGIDRLAEDLLAPAMGGDRTNFVPLFVAPTPRNHRGRYARHGCRGVSPFDRGVAKYLFGLAS